MSRSNLRRRILFDRKLREWYSNGGASIRSLESFERIYQPQKQITHPTYCAIAGNEPRCRSKYVINSRSSPSGVQSKCRMPSQSGNSSTLISASVQSFHFSMSLELPSERLLLIFFHIRLIILVLLSWVIFLENSRIS